MAPQQGPTPDQSENYRAWGIRTCFLLLLTKKKLKKNLKTPAALVTSFRVSTSDLSLIYYSKRPLSSFYFIFYFLINVQSPPTVSSLGHCCNNQPYSGDAGKWCPNLPSLLLPRFLPLVKLPAGYYRDVFINAVYGSLSALFFLCVYLLISCTQCPLKLPPFFSLFFLFLTGVFFFWLPVFSFTRPFYPPPLPCLPTSSSSLKTSLFC